MSYHLLIEGIDGARRVCSGRLPRRGEWLKVHLGSDCWWLPVLEVAHLLSQETRLSTEDGEGAVTHARAEPLLVSSLALGVRARGNSALDTYEFVLPPCRWPLGGRTEDIGI